MPISSVIFLATLCGSVLTGVYAVLISTNSTAGVIAYTLASILGALGSVIALQLRKTRRDNAALLVSTVLVSCFAAELILMATKPIPLGEKIVMWRQQKAIAAGQKFDTRSRLQFVTDLRKTNPQAWPSAPPSGRLKAQAQQDPKQLFPLSGAANTLTVHCNEAGDWFTFNSDDHGFNNPTAVTQQALVEVATIGDSFVMGACTPADTDIASQLRQQGFNVANFGYAGNGPLLELATLREYARHFKPKQLLWFFYEGNDLQNLAEERKVPALRAYTAPGYSQNLLANATLRNQAITSYIESKLDEVSAHPFKQQSLFQVLRSSHLRHSISSLFSQKTAAIDKPALKPLFRHYQQILELANQEAQQWGGQVHLIYLPDWSRYGDSKMTPVDAALLPDIEREIVKLADKLGVPVVNFRDRIEQSDDPLQWFPWRLHGHYTEAGYRLLAEQIAEHLSHYK